MLQLTTHIQDKQLDVRLIKFLDKTFAEAVLANNIRRYHEAIAHILVHDLLKEQAPELSQIQSRNMPSELLGILLTIDIENELREG